MSAAYLNILAGNGKLSVPDSSPLRNVSFHTLPTSEPLIVRLQLNSFLYVLDRRTVLFLLGMSPGAVHVSNVTLGIEFDGAIEVGDSPIPVLMLIFGI